MQIVVLGSVNLDLSARVSELPKAGETVTGASLAKFPGGKGANQALAARKLGASVNLVACVGRDDDADQALLLLREFDVNLEHCMISDNAPTGIALICVADDGENHIVVAPGANRTVSIDEIEFPKGDALICQLEVPIDTLAKAIQQFSGFVCVNLAPACDVDAVIFSRSDLIVVNEVEFDWYGEKLSAFRGLLAVTYGKQGAKLFRDGFEMAAATPPTVTAVDTTGAGDTFTAALTVALLENYSEQDALSFACKAAALATTVRGAQPSLPMRADVDTWKV